MHVLHEKAKAISLLILDVDGILTTGTLYYGQNGEELKCFHVHDGLGIKLLQKFGLPIAIISSKQSEMVLTRLKHLDIQYVYLGQDNKLLAYNELKKQLQIDDKQIAYMGDDLPDLPLLRRAGFAITVPDAQDIIRQRVDLVTTHPGGRGAVREVCELIMAAKGWYQTLIESYDL